VTDDPRIEQASRLILEGEYERARQLLLDVDSPEARKWLAQIPSSEEMDGLLLGLMLVATLAFAGLFAIRAGEYAPLYRATDRANATIEAGYSIQATNIVASATALPFIFTQTPLLIITATPFGTPFPTAASSQPALAPEFIQATNIVGTATALPLIHTQTALPLMLTQTPLAGNP
jgi:hypothetical protein